MEDEAKDDPSQLEGLSGRQLLERLSEQEEELLDAVRNSPLATYEEQVKTDLLQLSVYEAKLFSMFDRATEKAKLQIFSLLIELVKARSDIRKALAKQDASLTQSITVPTVRGN